MEFIVVKRMEARVGNGKHRQSPLTTSSTDVPQLKSLGYVRNPEISGSRPGDPHHTVSKHHALLCAQ